MAENNDEELSMEDILSSIKNILAEDEAEKTAVAAETSSPDLPPEPEAADPVVDVVSAPVESVSPEAEDDILDLSPSMRVMDKEAQTPEINISEELEGISASAPVVPEAEPAIEPENISLEQELDNPVLDNSDPFYTPEEDDRTTVVAEPEPETTSEVSPLAEVAPEDDVVSTATPIAELISEPVQKPEPVYAAPEPIPATIIEPKPQDISQPVYAEPQQEVVDAPSPSDAVDVSASIINNFAKMFSKKEPEPQPVVAAVAEPVKNIGNGSQTITDVVADVIRQIIGAEVAHHWHEGLDYNQLAREEISRQTKLWLDANLPAIVEKTVKNEIERVMAKVGTEQ